MIIKFDPTKTKTKTTITITKTKTNTLINYQIIKFDPEYPYKHTNLPYFSLSSLIAVVSRSEVDLSDAELPDKDVKILEILARK